MSYNWPSDQVPTPKFPSQEIYAPSTLNLLTRTTRTNFMERYQKQPPPRDPGRRPKYWWDASAVDKDPTGLYIYKAWILDAGGYMIQKEFFMTNKEAAEGNLPGEFSYPPFNPPPLDAKVVWFDSFLPAPNPTGFCTLAAANKLKADILADTGKDMLVVENEGIPEGSPGSIIYAPTEPRRQYELHFEGQPSNCGLLIQRASSMGIGYPGKWSWEPPAEGSTFGWVLAWTPSYVADISGQFDSRPEWPVPMRGLSEEEKWLSTMAGWQVQRITPPPVTPAPQTTLVLDPQVAKLIETLLSQQSEYWLNRLLQKIGGAK